MSFKNNLHYLREKRGLTQEELAKLLYVTQATISQYENGTQFPPPMKLRQIADFFKIKENDLVK